MVLVLGEAFLPQVGDELGHLAVDGCAVGLEARSHARRDFRFRRAGLDLAHDGGRRRIEREDLLRARLEEHAAELFLAKFHVLGKLHVRSWVITCRALSATPWSTPASMSRPRGKPAWSPATATRRP